MKTLITLSPFLLLVLFSISGTAVGRTPAVIDVDGNEVINGQFYYVVSAIRGAGGGGLLLADMLNGTCPLNVIQSHLDVVNGLAIILMADNSEPGGYVHESSNVVLRFVAITLCPNDGSLVWKVGRNDESTGQKFILSGGDGCRNSWFKIEREDTLENVYKFVYCISGECKDVGVYDGGEGRRLALSETPLLVTFKRVPYGEI